MKYIINILLNDGTLTPLTYAAADYATQADIITDKTARNIQYGNSAIYVITPETTN